MNSTEEIAAVKAKIAALEAKIADLEQQLTSKSLSEPMELVIQQRIVATQNTLNILLSQSALPGKKY
jgi:hypothetical protein